jgi:hypothetical protein
MLEAVFAAAIPLDRHAGHGVTADLAYAVSLLEIQRRGAVLGVM